MQIYKVGGAVRDTILNKQIHDNDYVVIGATEQKMLSLGYKKIGKSFPVFINPQTKEEYALARKEIKKGDGHRGFKFIFTPDISLKEDSIRRDFTCNALYQDLQTGEIIDYHKGMEDINNRILRHISPHFSEDPLRVLRMCRFAAELDFAIAPETMDLCIGMVKSGALKQLSSVRIWQEFEKALSCQKFVRFIETARECGALKELFPDIEALFTIPERNDYHPEGNSGKHTLLALEAAQSNDALTNFTILFHDIGKTKTDPSRWPSHHFHDKLGAELLKKIGKRMQFPKKYLSFASFTIAHHMVYHINPEDAKRELAEIALFLSQYPQKEYFDRFIAVLNADMNGRERKTPPEDIHSFTAFSACLEKLALTASKKRPSDLPEFPKLLSGIKKGTLAPSIIKETYYSFLWQEMQNPSV